MSVISLLSIIANMTVRDGVYQVNIPESWMQGRTTYGGLSAALCLQVTQTAYADLPPLRSAMISFIGPVGNIVNIKPTVLRKGKSVTYINVEMFNTQNQLATLCQFCFGATRESELNHLFVDAPQVNSPESYEDFLNFNHAPAFTKNFDVKLISGDRPISASEKHEFYLWCRHKYAVDNNMVTLLSIADMPPPAAMPMMKTVAPISSMTWMINFITSIPETENGWWLLNSQVEHVQQGYSSQNMRLWNSQGELMAIGRQSVAIFS